MTTIRERCIFFLVNSFSAKQFIMTVVKPIRVFGLICIYALPNLFPRVLYMSTCDKKKQYTGFYKSNWAATVKTRKWPTPYVFRLPV